MAFCKINCSFEKCYLKNPHKLNKEDTFLYPFIELDLLKQELIYMQHCAILQGTIDIEVLKERDIVKMLEI